MSLDRVMEGDKPRRELEASSLAAESLTSALQCGTGECADSFASHRSGHGVSEVDLPLAFPLSKTLVQEVRGIDKEWFLAEGMSVGGGGW